MDGTCTIEGCGKAARTRGWCSQHYTAWRRHGDPLVTLHKGPDRCSIDGCDRVHYARGWCTRHYALWHSTGDPLGIGRRYERETCSVEDCSRPFSCRELCSMHYKRWSLTGTTDLVPRGVPNQHGARDDDVCTLTITHPTNGTEWVALHDRADLDLVTAHRWFVCPTGYVTRWTGPAAKRVLIPLHRDVLGLRPGDGTIVDHRNGRTLDDRRANLRVVTQQINSENTAVVNNRGTSRYRGVSWSERRQRWMAQVQHHGRSYNLGEHSTEARAAAAVAAFRQINRIEAGY